MSDVKRRKYTSISFPLEVPKDVGDWNDKATIGIYNGTIIIKIDSDSDVQLFDFQVEQLAEELAKFKRMEYAEESEPAANETVVDWKAEAARLQSLFSEVAFERLEALDKQKKLNMQVEKMTEELETLREAFKFLKLVRKQGTIALDVGAAPDAAAEAEGRVFVDRNGYTYIYSP